MQTVDGVSVSAVDGLNVHVVDGVKVPTGNVPAVNGVDLQTDDGVNEQVVGNNTISPLEHHQSLSCSNMDYNTRTCTLTGIKCTSV